MMQTSDAERLISSLKQIQRECRRRRTVSPEEVENLSEYNLRKLRRAAGTVLSYSWLFSPDNGKSDDDEESGAFCEPVTYRTNEGAVWRAIIREQREEPLPSTFEEGMYRAYDNLTLRDGETEYDRQRREDLCILAENFDTDLSQVMVGVLGMPEDTPLPDLPDEPERAHALDEWLLSGLDIFLPGWDKARDT